MRARTLWLAGLVAAGLALAPAAARAQQPELFPDVLTIRAQTPEGQLPDPEVPLPLGHNPNNKGGLYMAAQFLFFRQTNPLEHQQLAFRGFYDADGGIPATLGRPGSFGVPGTVYGSGALALDAKDAGGPGTYTPGMKMIFGWQFKDGTSVDIDWMHLWKAQYFHEATTVPPGFHILGDLSDSFLWSPVYNFNNNYVGPQNGGPGSDGVRKIPLASRTALNGIWDGADIMTISFIQRTEEVQANLRVPIFYNDDFGYRMYGLVGPRFFWIWERFYWRTVNQNADGTAAPTDVAIYTNIVSNRMYGVHAGVGNEWYIGHGFACNLDLEAATFIDVVKERAAYQLGDKFLPGQIKRAKTDYSFVPELSASLNLTWYPIENVELKLGYDFMAFFNTISAAHPVSFNVGGLDPPWSRGARWFDGFQTGLGILF